MSENTDTYFIPSRPEILLKLSHLVKAKELDISQICQVLKQDIALFSTVLATVNAPYFGLVKKITSIEHAVNLLGVNRVFNIVRLAALRNSLSTIGPMERFWDTGSDVAHICALLSRRFRDVNTDEAYTLGMLHDCGLPLMMHNFPDFKDFLAQVNGNSISGLHAAQIERYGISHYNLGYALTHAWHLPEKTCEAIRLQPEYNEFLQQKDDRDDIRTLLCILLIAKEISRKYRTYWRVREPDQPFISHIEPILDFMGICDYDFLDFRDDILLMMESR